MLCLENHHLEIISKFNDFMFRYNEKQETTNKLGTRIYLHSEW